MTELTETASFLGYVLLGFVVAVFLPHILFKFLAEYSVDLGWRRATTRTEELVAATLPSILFNLFAYGAWRALCALTPLDTYSVDWAVIASIFASDKGAFADFIYGGDLWRSAGTYLVLLYTIAGINGWLYGHLIHEVLERDDPDATLEGLTVAPLRPRLLYEAVGWFWHVFYKDALVPYAKWTIRETWLIVRTLDNFTYHGLFKRYEKSVNGFETISLVQVHRVYMDSGLEERYERGSMGVIRAPGELHIKWSQVADVTRVHPSRIHDIMWAQYTELKGRCQRDGLPLPAVPEDLDISNHEDDQEEGIRSPS